MKGYIIVCLDNKNVRCVQFCVHGQVFYDLVENMLSVFASTHQSPAHIYIQTSFLSSPPDGIYPDFSREDEEGEEDSFKLVLT